jgi:uncharacterized protein (DUF1015 family)
MADIRPFPGFRYDPRQAPLSRALCPPYDVIDPEQAAALRSDPVSAVHLELPQGGEEKYAAAARLWSQWRDSCLLCQDSEPSFYVVEERFRAAGKARKRTGFLAALSVKPSHAGWVLAHERTLAKPKEDRLKLLAAVGANVSPIFGLFADRGGRARKALAKTARKKPVAAGRMKSGVSYKLWPVADPSVVEALVGAVKPAKLLIADGHHRYEVSRAFHEQRATAGSETVLAYLCPEEDAGLVVLPTHRIVAGRELAEPAQRLAKLTACRSRKDMLARLERSRHPYAFGLFDGRFHLGEPRSKAGFKSGLCVEWLGKRLLADVSPDRIRYTPDAAKAEAMARDDGGTAVFVKPFPVAQIRRAVQSVGLLPPKSTYFFPKIATGLVFKSLE